MLRVGSEQDTVWDGARHKASHASCTECYQCGHNASRVLLREDFITLIDHLAGRESWIYTKADENDLSKHCTGCMGAAIRQKSKGCALPPAPPCSRERCPSSAAPSHQQVGRYLLSATYAHLSHLQPAHMGRYCSWKLLRNLSRLRPLRSPPQGTCSKLRG